MRGAKRPVVEKKQANKFGSGVWPFIAILMVIIGAAVIRGRLLSLPMERDEGEYAYIAQEMLKGVPPYVSAYSMKQPGIYAVYALIMAAFGQTQTGIHLGLLIFNTGTIIVIYFLAKRLFGAVAGVAAGGIYAATSMISQVTGLWANAEHFVILPALLGLLLICKKDGKEGYIRLFAAGLLLGLSFIIKQHGIFIAIFAALYIISRYLRDRPIRWLNVIASLFVLAVGVVIPFACVCLFFWHNGTFDKFWFWTFGYAREYTTKVSLADAWELFTEQAGLIAKESYPVWLLAILGLFAVIIIKRNRQWTAFAVGLLIFSFMAVCPGFYFRGHYFIIMLPAAAILGGAGLDAIDGLFSRIMPLFPRVVMTIVIGSIVVGYPMYNQRSYLFNLSTSEVCRRVYIGNPFSESLPIAEYIRHNSGVDDTVAIAGSEPQLYFYSGRRSATSYIYMYPLMDPGPSARDMQQEMISQIEAARPKIMVFVNISASWLKRPDSITDIKVWFESYSTNYYDLTGLIEIYSDRPTAYYWNNDAKNRAPASPYWLAVFKRRQ